VHRQGRAQIVVQGAHVLHPHEVVVARPRRRYLDSPAAAQLLGDERAKEPGAAGDDDAL